MKIYVAGAGAGKTTSMVNRIIDIQKELNAGKIVYCITFTNNAAQNIEDRLIKHHGILPKNIHIGTIHSFFYREFIKPYYYLLYGKHYRHISTSALPQEVKYRRSRLKQLEDNNVLHQSVIPERAKWVVVKKSTDKKDIMQKRNIVLATFKDYCGSICIDEAQDMDADMKLIFETLNALGIPIYLIGDPKQDVKGYRSFQDLISRHTNDVEYINSCYRCPQKHLNISNLLVPTAEQQKSEKTGGAIHLYFESDISCFELIASGSFDLKYISQKQGVFETHDTHMGNGNFELIIETLEQKLIAKHPDWSEAKVSRTAFYGADLLLANYDEMKDKQKAISSTFSYGYLSTSEYAKIITALPDNAITKADETVHVCSIDSIKGLEGENCLFILTSDLAAYLFGGKPDETKTKCRLYVALTRSLEKLTIFITSEVEKTYCKDSIVTFFERHITS